MTRLGYRSSKTLLNGQQHELLEETIALGFSLCQPRGCWLRIAIKEKQNEAIILQDGSKLVSSSLTRLLQNSHAVALLAATVGADIVSAATQAIANGNGAAAIILDAVGGQSADATMSWINEYIRGQLSRRGERLTAHRFSPGYGDFSLNNQKLMFSLLKLEQLDLSLTSRAMLLPEKSVTAVAGIEPALPAGQTQ